MSSNLKLLSDLINEFVDSDLFSYYTKMFGNTKPLKKHHDCCFDCDSLFEGGLISDNGEHYELSMPVNPKSTAKNITIDVEDGNVHVEYCFKDKTTTSTTNITETLPTDADQDNMSAIVENGILTITIGKKEETTNESDDSDKIVKINKK